MLGPERRRGFALGLSGLLIALGSSCGYQPDVKATGNNLVASADKQPPNQLSEAKIIGLDLETLDLYSQPGATVRTRESYMLGRTIMANEAPDFLFTVYPASLKYLLTYCGVEDSTQTTMTFIQTRPIDTPAPTQHAPFPITINFSKGQVGISIHVDDIYRFALKEAERYDINPTKRKIALTNLVSVIINGFAAQGFCLGAETDRLNSKDQLAGQQQFAALTLASERGQDYKQKILTGQLSPAITFTLSGRH